nr:DNA-binding domain-containing protein [uncultured Shinella sp.]
MSPALQSAFAAGLFGMTPTPAGLIAWNTPTPDRRYGIYRNNVMASLTAALASRFPAAESIVGPDFFRAMARAFIQAHPPSSPVLLIYGDDLPDFVTAFAPARELAYLSDVMRLEIARERAYHAADIPPLDPTAFATIDPARLGTLVFTPHPALSVLSSPYPVVTIWAMNAGERRLAPIDVRLSEHALIARPHLTVEVTPLSPGGAVFFHQLAARTALATAAESAMSEHADFDLSDNLAVLLRSGAFAAINQDDINDDRHRD